jgi:hypothetical protein
MLATLTLAAALAVPPPAAPETRYDPRIPTLKQVTGHELGEAISTPEEIGAYLQALAAAAPDRARVVEYAKSEEGRPLRVLVLGSPERLARLEEVQKQLRALADPRSLSPAEADRLVRELPAVVWLLHAVHGNEISSPDAALELCHHLLAAQDDPGADLVRRETIVLVDPLQNPDGRARFLASNALGRAASPDPEPASAEHDEPWPGGRGNHYLFDMNRDWFAQTQPETRGRLRLFLDWYPHVTVDLHEMGGESTYYFAPPARPLNPYFSRAQQEWLDSFGRAIAARFDAAGQAYFVREVFDSFYPGYGESWPMGHGAVGMTFEQASARGLVWRREDDTRLTYLDGIRNHFRSGLATVETAARGREKLLRDFLEFRRTAVRDGEQGSVRQYVLVPGRDADRARRLADLLLGQGIEVRRLVAETRSGDRAFPAGSFVVPLAQPAGRLARNLLDPRVSMDEAFVKEQERRRKKRLDYEIYDVTGWSLPYAFGVECVALGVPLGGEQKPYAAPPPTSRAPEPAKVAWLLPWGEAAAAAVAEALQDGLKVRVAEAGFRLGGRSWLPGTAIVRVAENPADAGERLARIAGARGAEVVAADSGYVEEGVSLGSGRVRVLAKPRVLLAWDRPTSSQSAGWARWVLERRYGQPVSAVRTSALRRVDLGRFDVVVLPSGDYGDAIGSGLVTKLRSWVEAGGTLVALGEAARWLTRDKVELLATTTQLRDGRPDVEAEPADAKKAAERPAKDAKDRDAKPEAFDLEKAIQPERERPDAVPGAQLRVTLDTEHWLSAGSDGEICAIVESQRVFLPLKLDKGTNVGVYARKEEVVGSGLVWDDVRDLLAQKAFLMHQPLGEGHVIAFAEDPNYRGYAESTELLFMNAVLLGPAY